MEQTHTTTTTPHKSPKFHRLNINDRAHIERWIKEGLNTLQIANRLGVSRRTIQYELKRGRTPQLVKNPSNNKYQDSHITVYPYFADVAQNDYLQKQKNKGRPLKIGHDHALVDFIEHKISKERWSPQVVLGYIKTHHLVFDTQICLQTLYNYIHQGLFLRISDKDLWQGARRKRKRRLPYKRPAWNNLKGTSIEERPASIDNRETFGHWEIDLVVGAKGSPAAILTLVERQTRYLCTAKLKNKSQEAVCAALSKIYRRLKPQFKAIAQKPILSITADNGTEFLNSEAIMKAAHCDAVYYAHPYSSWERGSNENINRMLRRFLPKGTRFSKLKQHQLKRIEGWINHYPRPLLQFRSAHTCFCQRLAIGENTF